MIQVGRKPKAILFDCDGVLVDTTPLHIQAFLTALRPYGVTELDYSRIAGLPTRDSFIRLGREKSLKLGDADLDTLTRTKQTEFSRLAELAGPDVYPPLGDLFKKLRDRFQLAVVSSASRPSLDRALRKCGISPWISVHLSAEDVLRTKPSPDPYAEACRRLAVDPKEALVVEDAQSGIESGVAAGCAVVGFRIPGPQGMIFGLPEILAWAEEAEDLR